MSDLWDMALRFGEAVQAAECLAELRSDAQPRCGECTHWMKSKECPREVNVNGWNRGPNVNGTPCDSFNPTKRHLENVAAFKAEIGRVRP
jgi:hypothetical protein